MIQPFKLWFDNVELSIICDRLKCPGRVNVETLGDLFPVKDKDAQDRALRGGAAGGATSYRKMERCFRNIGAFPASINLSAAQGRIYILLQTPPGTGGSSNSVFPFGRTQAIF